jgi:hypothetical protein
MRFLCGLVNIAVAALLLCGCDSILFERHAVTSGAFRGIEIGATKEATLRQIRELGASAVRAEPTEAFVITQQNKQELTRIKGLDEDIEGVQIVTTHGLSIDVFFREGAVDTFKIANPMRKVDWLRKGEPIDDLIRTLSDLMEATRDYAVVPLVRANGRPWVELDEPFEKDLSFLRKFSAWSFELSADPDGSIFRLHFDGDRLARLDYRRPRVRLD